MFLNNKPINKPKVIFLTTKVHAIKLVSSLTMINLFYHHWLHVEAGGLVVEKRSELNRYILF